MRIDLKKIILEIVNNQIKDNNPPITKQVYEELLAAGYSISEAKEKIGSVVLSEIYEVTKDNQSYDEKRYTAALKEMLQQCLDFESVYRIPTEWDRWDEMVQRGYEALTKGNETQMVSYW